MLALQVRSRCQLSRRRRALQGIRKTMARLDFSSLRDVERAAQCGAADALFELGKAYATGRNVASDLVAAHKWFNLAALRGNRRAREYRMELAREMSKAEILEAQRQAREWLAAH